VPELDTNGSEIDLRYFARQAAANEEKYTSQTLKDPEPVLPARIASQSQDYSGAAVVSTTPSPSPEKQMADANRSTGHSCVTSKIPQPHLRPPQAISKCTRRCSARLDSVMEAENEDGLDEPRNAMDLKDHLEAQVREQVAKNRASFWDTLSDEQSLSSRHSLDFNTSTALGMSPPGPRKLRKRKSFALADHIASTIAIATTVGKGQVKNRLKKNVQIVSSPVMMSPHDCPRLALPTGIVQKGQGIGFNYSLSSATLSKTSICSSTPRTCHGLSLKGFSSLARKAKRRVGQELSSPMSSETDEEREMAAVMREIYGSTWSLGMSAVNLSMPLASLSTSSPLSSSPSPVMQIPEAPEFADADEAVNGDPDSTLRLVSPTSPLCD
jgi:hypothetical protein